METIMSNIQAPQITKGQYIICTHNTGVERELTIGGRYLALYTFDENVELINDQNESETYGLARFAKAESRNISYKQLNQAVLDFAAKHDVQLFQISVKFTGLWHNGQEQLQAFANPLTFDIDQDAWTTSAGTRMEQMRGRIQITVNR